MSDPLSAPATASTLAEDASVTDGERWLPVVDWNGFYSVSGAAA